VTTATDRPMRLANDYLGARAGENKRQGPEDGDVRVRVAGVGPSPVDVPADRPRAHQSRERALTTPGAVALKSERLRLLSEFIAELSAAKSLPPHP
jgi:hypothetical protein